MVKLTQADVIAAERELCRRSLAYFAKRAWHVLEPGTPLKWGWALDAICAHLEAVTRGDISRLLMNVPPGCMKSLLTGVIWPAWEFGPQGRPDRRIIATAHKQDLAIRDNMKCRRLVQSQWYQARWPIALTSDQNAKTKFETTATGFREAMAFTSMTGARGDCLVGDTLVETQDGEISIRDIAVYAKTCNVLSYDTHTKKLVYRPVQAVARSASSDIYRVHTSDGRVVECTGDHRFYTRRGFVAARLLSADDVLLLAVWQGAEAKRIRDEEGKKERLSGGFLRQDMLNNLCQLCGWENWAAMHGLRQTSAAREGRLFSGVPCGRAKAFWGKAQQGFAHGIVRDLRDAFPRSVTCGGGQVLFSGLQGLGPQTADRGGVKPRLARRSGQGPVSAFGLSQDQRNAPADLEAGRKQVRSLQIDRRSGDAPYRHGCDEQPAGQLSHALPDMPRGFSRSGAPSTEAVSVALVERVRRAETVYDLQVEGTRCFFANGVLVHNCVILDDPLSADDANSQAALDAAELTFLEALPTRVNNEKSAIVVIMQRLHERDTSGLILSRGLPYEHLCLPMRFEPDRRCATGIGFTDPREKAGELLFPDRFPEAMVSDLERTLGSYATAGQLQQRPTPRGGGMFRKDWFQTIPALPTGCRFVRGWDLAATDDADAAATAGVLMARAPDGRFIIVDVKREQLSPAGVARLLKATADQDRAAYGQIRGSIPQDPGQAGKSQARFIITDTLVGHDYHASPETGDKETRALPFAAQAEAGNVWMMPGEWNTGFLDEIALFPKGKWKDQVDAASRAFSELVEPAAPAMVMLKSRHR